MMKKVLISILGCALVTLASSQIFAGDKGSLSLRVQQEVRDGLWSSI